jgi:hypothetical protein
MEAVETLTSAVTLPTLPERLPVIFPVMLVVIELPIPVRIFNIAVAEAVLFTNA